MKTPTTQTDQGLYFDGVGSGPKAGSSRYAHNRFTGHSNDGRTVQMSQQPNRRGNDGTCGHSGMAQTGIKPPASVPDTHAPGAYGKAPYRGVGGTKMPALGGTEFNQGRGPTRGNSQ